MRKELEREIEMFLQALSDRCKTCFTKGRCNECFSLPAKKLLNDIAFDRVQSIGMSVMEVPGMTAAERHVLDQLKAGNYVRSDHIEMLYPMSVHEKRELFALMVQRGVLVVERRQHSGKNFSYYRIKCKTHEPLTPQASPTLSKPERQDEAEKNSLTRFGSDSSSAL